MKPKKRLLCEERHSDLRHAWEISQQTQHRNQWWWKTRHVPSGIRRQGSVAPVGRQTHTFHLLWTHTRLSHHHPHCFASKSSRSLFLPVLYLSGLRQDPLTKSWRLSHRGISLCTFGEIDLVRISRWKGYQVRTGNAKTVSQLWTGPQGQSTKF